MPVTTPFTTRFTRPVFFSRTRKSFGPRKAIVLGVVSPLTTVRTARSGSTTLGPTAWAAAGGAAAPTENASPLRAAARVSVRIKPFTSPPGLGKSVQERGSRRNVAAHPQAESR